MDNIIPFRPIRPVEAPNVRKAALRIAVTGASGGIVNSGIHGLLMVLGDTCRLASDAFDAAFDERVDVETRSAVVELTHASLAVQSVFIGIVGSPDQAPEGYAPLAALAAAEDYAATLDAVSPIIFNCPIDLMPVADGLGHASVQLRERLRGLEPSDLPESLR